MVHGKLQSILTTRSSLRPHFVLDCCAYRCHHLDHVSSEWFSTFLCWWFVIFLPTKTFLRIFTTIFSSQNWILLSTSSVIHKGSRSFYSRHRSKCLDHSQQFSLNISLFPDRALAVHAFSEGDSRCRPRRWNYRHRNAACQYAHYISPLVTKRHVSRHCTYPRSARNTPRCCCVTLLWDHNRRAHASRA